tara:strand:+ start:105 stop:269 length:165 start_codon:yes stop_codon:yes gene_type:complete
MDDDRLIIVVQELNRLKRLVDDLEWEDQDASHYKRELEHFEELNRKGILYDTKF